MRREDVLYDLKQETLFAPECLISGINGGA